MIGTFEQTVEAILEGVRKDVLTQEFVRKLGADLAMILNNFEKWKTAGDVRVVAKGLQTFGDYLNGMLKPGGMDSPDKFVFPGSVQGAIASKADEWVTTGRFDNLTAQIWLMRWAEPISVQAQNLFDAMKQMVPFIKRKRGVPNRFQVDAIRNSIEFAWSMLEQTLAGLILDVQKYDRNAKPLTLNTPVPELVHIEGLPVTVQGYDADDKEHSEMLSMTRDGIREYLRLAKQRLPELVRLTDRVNILFGCPPGLHGVYYRNSSTINICVSEIWRNVGTVAEFVKTLAHETGHHFYQKVLSQASRDLWKAAVESDVEPLDVRAILDAWKPSISFCNDAIRDMANTNPKLACHLSLITSFGVQSGSARFVMPPKRDEFEKAVRSVVNDPRVRQLRVPKHPVTGYGSTDQQEAFSEVTGTLVVFGHRGIHPAVLNLYRIVTQWEI